MDKTSDQKATSPNQAGDTTQTNRNKAKGASTGFPRNSNNNNDPSADSDHDQQAQQVTPKDVIKKQGYSPDAKGDAKAPLQAGRGNDEVMSQPPQKQS